jgi:hypothetical protein
VPALIGLPTDRVSVSVKRPLKTLEHYEGSELPNSTRDGPLASKQQVVGDGVSTRHSPDRQPCFTFPQLPLHKPLLMPVRYIIDGSFTWPDCQAYSLACYDTVGRVIPEAEERLVEVARSLPSG